MHDCPGHPYLLDHAVCLSHAVDAARDRGDAEGATWIAQRHAHVIACAAACSPPAAPGHSFRRLSRGPALRASRGTDPREVIGWAVKEARRVLLTTVTLLWGSGLPGLSVTVGPAAPSAVKTAARPFGMPSGQP